MSGMAHQIVAIALVQLLVLDIEMEHSPSSCLCTERMVETKIDLKSSCKQENWQKACCSSKSISYPYLLSHLCSDKIIYVPVQLFCFTKLDTALEKQNRTIKNYVYRIKKTNWNSKIIQIKWVHTSHRLTKFKSKFWRDNREKGTWSLCFPFIYLFSLYLFICCM